VTCEAKSHSAANGFSEVDETGHGGFGSRTPISLECLWYLLNTSASFPPPPSPSLSTVELRTRGGRYYRYRSVHRRDDGRHMMRPLSSTTTIWGHLGPVISPTTSSFIPPIRMGISVSKFMSPNRHVPRLAFAPEPVGLPIKSDQNDEKKMPMDAFVCKSCPSLYLPYNPPRWMHK